MPRSVRITVKGLAICFKDRDDDPDRPGAWNVLFVCDPKHPLTLTEPKNKFPIPTLRRPRTKFTCEFSGTFSERAPGNHPDELLNLNGNLGHRGALEWIERDCMDTSKILMRLPRNAQISVSDTTSDYHIQEVGGQTATKINGEVATEIQFDFEITAGQMMLTIGDDDKVVYSEAFNGNSGETLSFTFNNHCDKKSCLRNDSLELYEVIQEPLDRTSERRFVTGNKAGSHVPGYDAGPHCPPASGKGKVDTPLKPLTYPHGNCDPAGLNPPPDGNPLHWFNVGN